MKKDERRAPILRFKGFSDDWEQRKLGDVVTRVTRKNTNLESKLVLTISGQLGLVSQLDYFNKNIAGNNLKNYFLIKKDEFAYNRSYSKGYPLGAIKQLEFYDYGILSTLYILFKTKENSNISPKFLKAYYSTNKWYSSISKLVTEGARNHGLLNISANDFFKSNIVLPMSLDEQKLISKFMVLLEKSITLHQRKLSCYARLQAQYIKLFYNVKGLKTRKLCFTNFSSKITLCKLKDISNYENSNFTSTIPSELIENGSYPIYDANIEIAKINTYAQSTPYISIIKDGAGAGRVDLKPAYTSVIGTMGYILAKPGVDIIYLYYLIKNINFDKYQNGSTIPHVYYKDYKEEQVLLPELPEQIKIGKFLLSLEKNIQYSQKLLEELNTIKSSYLNYMFI